MNTPGDIRPTRLLAELSLRIDRVLSSIVPQGSKCALLDFPNYSNVGDSALWLGELEWLRRNHSEIVYGCDIYTFSPEIMASRLGDGIILLSGGGNLGDFWIDHQRLRQEIIEAFPRNRIIQLPQSIHFVDDADILETARVFDAHPNFTLLVRDQASRDLADRHFKCPTVLCPDMAFALAPLPPAGVPDTDILWLARTDAEAASEALPASTAGLTVLDWTDEPSSPLVTRSRQLWQAMFERSADTTACAAELMALHEPLARERLARGCAILARGRVVITDRLHGHILCLLQGIPHVLLDNSYGKVLGFHRMWTSGDPLTRTASSTKAALEMARRMLAQDR
jgi:pyruvyl transferase EpsO